MQNYKKLVILLVILAVLLAVVLSLQKRQGKEVTETRMAQTAPMFPDLEPGNIMRIEISSLQNESLLLRKNSGVWEVAPGKDVMGGLIRQSEDTSGAEGENIEPENPADDLGPTGDVYRTFHTADMEKVQPMLDAITQMPNGQIVTSNRDKFSQFGVLGAITGIEVRMYDSEMNVLAEVMVGNQGATMTNTYVRPWDDDDVHEVSGRLSMMFGTDMASMRDRNIFNSPPETITVVNIVDNVEGLNFSLARADDGGWSGVDSFGNPLELDPAKIDNLLSSLGNLSANSFVDTTTPPMPASPDEVIDETDPYGILNPTMNIIFTTADIARHSVRIGRLEGTTYYAALDEDIHDVFKISKTTIDAITPDPAILAPGAEVETIETEEVETGDLEAGEEVNFDDLPPEIQAQIRDQMGQ